LDLFSQTLQADSKPTSEWPLHHYIPSIRTPLCWSRTNFWSRLKQSATKIFLHPSRSDI